MELGALADTETCGCGSGMQEGDVAEMPLFAALV